MREYLPAWSADRWTVCPASARMPRAGWPTRPPSDLSRECKAIQAAAAAIIRVEVSAAEELVDRIAPGGWIMTAELVHHAHAFARVVLDYGNFWVIECGSILESWGGVGAISGFAAIDEAGRLHVFSLDYGWNVVELEGDRGDLQLALLAILMTEKMDPEIPHRVELGAVLHVYQPRPYHKNGPWRSRSTTSEELTNMHNWLGHRAEAAHGQNSPAVVSRECVGCAHSGACEVLRRQAYLDRSYLAGDLFGERPTAEGLSRMLVHAEDHSKLAEERLTALRREARARIAAGEWIPGYGQKAGYGDRELRDPAAAELCTGVRSTKIVSRTPAEMERDGADPDVLALFTHRPHTGPRLVKMTSAEAQRSFKT